MNANELADVMEKYSVAGFQYPLCDEFKQAATMLRQQQAEIERLIMLCDCMTTASNRKGNEIEALKQIIDANNLSQNIGQFVKPTNKPVAWMPIQSKHTRIVETKPDDEQNWIPLYTHPVKEQDVKYNVTVKWDDKITHHKNVSVDTPLHYTHPVELTDEEIIIIYQDLWKFLPSEEPDLAKDIKKFARAILRKAQEK